MRLQPMFQIQKYTGLRPTYRYIFQNKNHKIFCLIEVTIIFNETLV
jgi:hypothetical protein